MNELIGYNLPSQQSSEEWNNSSINGNILNSNAPPPVVNLNHQQQWSNVYISQDNIN